MITEIRGYLIKYGEPWPDGSVVEKGALDNFHKDGDIIPIYDSFHKYFDDSKEHQIGIAKLYLENDGVRYVMSPFKDENAQLVLQKAINIQKYTDDSHSFYIGPFCNHISRDTDNDAHHIKKCRIVYGSINRGKYSSAYIETIKEEYDAGELTDENAIRIATNLDVYSSVFFRGKSSNVFEIDNGEKILILMDKYAYELVGQSMREGGELILKYRSTINDKNKLVHDIPSKACCPNPNCKTTYAYFYKDWKYCPKCGTELKRSLLENQNGG